jgi:hypothetical protein
MGAALAILIAICVVGYLLYEAVRLTWGFIRKRL